MILDIDLDFFNLNQENYDDNPCLLPHYEIKRVLTDLKKCCDWDVVTVALSPEHCGGNKPCESLLGIFLDVFELDLKDVIKW